MNDELARLENLREACALEAIEALIEAGEDPRAADSLGDRLRDVPLDATPLADALARAEEGVRYWTDLAQAEARDAATLRARVAELERQREGMLMGGVTTEARQQLDRAEKAEAERDALRAKVFEVQQRQVGYVLVSFASHEQWKAELAERDALRAWVSAVSEALGAIEPVSDCRVELSADAAAALAGSLRAQVEAARATCARVLNAPSAVRQGAASDILAAMDGEKP